MEVNNSRAESTYAALGLQGTAYRVLEMDFAGPGAPARPAGAN
jgi:hypothetical protein